MSYDAAADEIDDKAFTVVIKVKYDDEHNKTMTDASGETVRYRCLIFSWNNLSMMSCYKVWEWLDMRCLFVYCLHGLCQKMWLGRASKSLACATWHLFFFSQKILFFRLRVLLCCPCDPRVHWWWTYHRCTGDWQDYVYICLCNDSKSWSALYLFPNDFIHMICCYILFTSLF